ncbi:MAG: Nif3-like dinuclear metal center hexameric protein [Thermoanaerobacteraceae bacterium]|nr:Nif3-like dinuclear metal center hexameric protein [Thermoanaerobacteraceae bacterium]
MVSCETVYKVIEEMAPLERAEKWDNVGLQIGEPEAPVQKVLVTLDITEQVVDEAVFEKADLIVSHHPFIFDSVKKIRFDEPKGRMIKKLICNNIMVYVAHTNLDKADEGVNHYLAQCLGLKDTRVLAPSGSEKLYKLVVFVPQDYIDQVRTAIGDAGAGWIGNYSHCTFRTPGQGTFKPLEGADPFIGEVGDLEQVEEYRLETIVPAAKLKPVLKAMFDSHPYEEVAYDLYPLANKGKEYGLGRIGSLPEFETLEAFALKVKQVLGTDQVGVVGDIQRPISKVAVCGGAGASMVDSALKHGAEVLLTGDIKFHQAQEALARGLAVVDAGHYATERVIVPVVARRLQEKLADKKVEIILSTENTNPWQYL